MHIKNKQKKPNRLTDLFNNLDLPDATIASQKLDKKNLNALLKEISLQESSNISELHQIKTHFKNIKELKTYIQIKIEYADKSYPYNFLNIRGSFIPEYLQKEIYACNFLDAEIMSKGELNSNNKIIQLFTAIVLVLTALIKSIIGKVMNPTITINESFERCQEIINTYEEDHHKLIFSIFNEIGDTVKTYKELSILDSFIEDPEIVKEICKKDPDLIDSVKNLRESLYIDSSTHLEQAINMCITQGLFKEYQRSPTTNEPKVLCQGHSLLNTKLLLRKLHGTALNTEGNLQKKRNYQAIDQRILELLKQDIFKKQFNNKATAAEKIADEIANELERFMKYDRINNHHNQYIKIENLPEKILQLIKKNPEIKEHLLHK